MSTTKASNRFTPPSTADFSTRAKSLAWLLEMPLQATQELLARAYGYSNLHELQAVIATAVPTAEEESLRFASSVENENRLLDLIAKKRGGSGKHPLAVLRQRDWLARDIGLFYDLPNHVREFQAIKASVEIEEGRQGPFPQRTAESTRAADYAVSHAMHAGDYTIAFTPLGSAVFKAIMRQRERLEYRHNPLPLDTFLSWLAEVGKRNPNNPWINAIQLCETLPLDLENNESLDEEVADHAFALARQSISLFESILGTHDAEYAGAKVVSLGDGHGTDSFYYPAVLYWGGQAALHASQFAIAETWFARCMMMDTRDGFGARYELAKIWGMRRTRGRAFDWHEGRLGLLTYLLRMAKAFDAGNQDLACSCLGMALAEGHWLAEQQIGYAFDGDSPRPPRDIAKLIAETRPFWDRHQGAKNYLLPIAGDERIKDFCRIFLRESIDDPQEDGEVLGKGIYAIANNLDLDEVIKAYKERAEQRDLIRMANEQQPGFL